MSSWRPGEMLGSRYRLMQPLGSGGYGEVWLALDTHRNLQVALKLLSRGASWAEAQILTALKNRYILEVHNADQFVDVRYLDTAVAAGSLESLIPPALEPSRAVSYIRQALRGLELCHERGLLHRDVKPANIFYDDNGDVRLGDFGIAAVVDAEGRAPALGDARYKSPESFSGSIDKATDIYAAGVTLWELVAGRRAFAQASSTDLQIAILAGDLPDVRDVAPHVSKALGRIIKQATKVDPKSRYSSAEEFDNALGALPTRRTQFVPVAPHDGHQQCWETSGARTLRVCATRESIDVRQISSNRAVRDYCSTPGEHKLKAALRRTFDSLRQ